MVIGTVEKLKKGVDKLADAVKVTLGPYGRNVAIQDKEGKIFITKDGVSVANQVHLSDKMENMGVKIIQDVSKKTDWNAGDGTTTSLVLTQSIINQGFKSVVSGTSLNDMKKGMEIALEKSLEFIDTKSRSIKGDWDIIRKVAKISCGDEEISQIIHDVMKEVGEDGVITLEESEGDYTGWKVFKEMEFEGSYLHEHFMPETEVTMTILNPLILVTDLKLTKIDDVIPVLEISISEKRHILILADSIEGEALSTILTNNNAGLVRVTVIEAPGFADRRKLYCEDIVAVVGGNFVSDDTSWSIRSLKFEDLGTCDSVEINGSVTKIFGGGGDESKRRSRIDLITAEISSSNSRYEREKMYERISRVGGCVGVVYVGAKSELELIEKKARVDDALSAVNSAINGGVMPGGGSTFIEISNFLGDLKLENHDQKIGVDIIRKALEEPLRQMVNNSGGDGSWIVGEVKNGRGVWNLKTCEFQDKDSTDVIDPSDVLRYSLMSAVSASIMILTTN